ncbi:GNAT family N-acetyltransferase [Henriciella sp. AS95]|uniref:GNAT family N-acetyltransferase n=1 Tax=Henriciella sp. AS95 TaxID=3135782 RepID=UPI003171729D
MNSLEELQQVFSIRAAVFMAEQSCPYREEFDGNDLSACHLLCAIDGEPVATLRLRWFASFGKVERVCVLPHARGQQLERIMLAHAFELAARKGYRLMTGQIQARLWPLWKRTVYCILRENRPSFSFSDYEYLEVDIQLPPHPHALTPLSDPYLLIRPEGNWDEKGVLEASVLRATANAA